MIKYIHRCNNPAIMKIWLAKGFGVEVDVWHKNDQLFSGHDEPEYLIELATLCNELVLVHAKDVVTLTYLHGRFSNKTVHYFFHDRDRATLTNWGLIVYHADVFLDRAYRSNEIAVLPAGDLGNCFGVVMDVLDAEINKQVIAA